MPRIESGPTTITGSVYVINQPAAGSNSVTVVSGSVTGLLVGGQPAGLINPLPITGSVSLSSAPVTASGSVTGLLVGGQPAGQVNQLPVESYDLSGQMVSGSTTRTVQYSTGNFSISGSSNQVIPPQGVGNRIRVLSVFAMVGTSVVAQFQSTGSAGSITNVSGLCPMAANGGFALPHNPHGWFQTNVNEGLNINIGAAVTVGLTLTWLVAGQ